MKTNYDKIARHYDFLSRIVFRQSQVKAQTDQFGYLRDNDQVLIVGGGTGWILEAMAQYPVKGLHIDYVEQSKAMIELSEKRNFAGYEVRFWAMGIENFTVNRSYDVVITPFLFDNFTAKQAEQVFYKLDSLLKHKGKWLMVDFTLKAGKGRWWKWMLLHTMYTFFRLTRIVGAKELIDMDAYFIEKYYSPLVQHFYYGSFIKAGVFQKQ